MKPCKSTREWRFIDSRKQRGQRDASEASKSEENPENEEGHRRRATWGYSELLGSRVEGRCGDHGDDYKK
ncbi:MAG: hypothetical protein ACF8CQ_03595 [Rhodopirellula sp. JB044]|uniref:hypothetical protein n=1 Tax=Rhodopirellula sp. JB044 TaxID=3342844 RepID=UPI00370C1D91